MVTKMDCLVRQIEEDLFVIDSGIEDFRSVVSAKTSRSLRMESRMHLSHFAVRDFLLQNLFGYGHASIAEMALPTIFSRGFGWVSAWILEDDPLFVGQELSLRASNPTIRFPFPCYDSPVNTHWLFYEYFRMWKQLSRQQSSGYKYDDIRWLMPGQVCTGVVSLMNARILARHLDRMRERDFLRETVRRYARGAEECCRLTFDSVFGKKRSHDYWTSFKFVQKGERISVTPLFELDEEKKKFFLNLKRCGDGYIDKTAREVGLFKVCIQCSVASARDWHRHRSVMPWTLDVVLENNALCFSEGCPKSNESLKFLLPATELLKSGLGLLDQNYWPSIYALPMGTLIQLTCVADFPSLVYMLELRAFSKGANKEYRDTALAGLRQLIKIFGREICYNLQIDDSKNIKS